MRLDYLQPDKESYPKGTLGHFRTLKEELVKESLESSFYLFLTQEQVIFYLDNYSLLKRDNLDPTVTKIIIGHMFPFKANKALPFVSGRTVAIFTQMAAEKANRWLPYLRYELVEHLMQMKVSLDYSRLSDEQMLQMFTSSYNSYGNIRTYWVGSIEIEILNQILPKMVPGQLKVITEKHLQDVRLNLRSLSPDKIGIMFPKDSPKINQLHEDNRFYVESIINSK